MTAAQTRTKANSVPTPTSSARTSIGDTAATAATTAPIPIWLIQGVPSVGWMRATTGGRSPSAAMVAKIRLWP